MLFSSVRLTFEPGLIEPMTAAIAATANTNTIASHRQNGLRKFTA